MSGAVACGFTYRGQNHPDAADPYTHLAVEEELTGSEVERKPDPPTKCAGRVSRGVAGKLEGRERSGARELKAR
jgi:hypothetical protein